MFGLPFRFGVLVAIALPVASLAAEAGPRGEAPGFPFVEADVGLDFHHFSGRTGRFYMPEINAGGVALLDFDGDGDLDVYFPQGQLLAPGEAPVEPPRHPLPLTDRLYRNDLVVHPDGRRELRFTDVTAAAGLVPAPFGFGVATGDYDGDGWIDLYVTRLGSNSLLRNRGDGTFEDTTAKSGTDDPRWSVPALFADFDADGWLDLYVGNYVDFSIAGNKTCRAGTGALDYCGPGAYAGVPDRLFRNRGDGTFEDVTLKAGLLGVASKSLGAVASDLDGDGRLDLYVASDETPNYLFLQNAEPFTFREEGMLAGCAVNGAGREQASMGLDAVDLDDDGDLDLVMTHLVRDTNAVFVNDGLGAFEDRSNESGLGLPSWSHTGWGVGFLDYDADGLLDVLVANGAVQRIEALATAGDPFPFHETNQLFRGLGGGRFEDVSASAGPAFARSEVSRALAVGDLDDDGDPDAVIVNNSGPARVLLATGGPGRWLGLRILERGRDALGARVEIRRPQGPTLYRRVRTEGSFAAAQDPRVLVGLGDDPRPVEVVVRFVDGRVERWPALAPGAYHTLRRGEGEPVPSAAGGPR